MPLALVVGGTDSSGGAGVSADLLTLAAHGVHGMLAVTAVTAQGIGGLQRRTDLSADVVAAQLGAAMALGPGVVKSGMLASRDAAVALAVALESAAATPYVCDPLFAATSGESLLDPAAVEVVREKLLPRATVCTPNVVEAALLTGGSPSARVDVLADGVLALGPVWVLVTGGDADATDLLAGADGTRVALRAQRVPTVFTRGTGCTLASALAARLVRGEDVPAAVRAAKGFVTAGLLASYPLAPDYGTLRRWRDT